MRWIFVALVLSLLAAPAASAQVPREPVHWQTYLHQHHAKL